LKIIGLKKKKRRKKKEIAKKKNFRSHCSEISFLLSDGTYVKLCGPNLKKSNENVA